MEQSQLIPHLFRTEYQKITAVLCRLFGLEHIEVAEDIAGDTFLLAAETWGVKGLPDNPVGWLYGVAKNKARVYLRRNTIFTRKIAPQIKAMEDEAVEEDIEIDLSDKNIVDSRLGMMFAVCNPAIPAESQVGLSLRVLCGFGIEEIADAFLTGKETINKRLYRAKEKLRSSNIKMELPPPAEIDARLETVLTTLYLLFNEGYYSASGNVTLRKDLCLEAARLALLLTENDITRKPAVYALLALMCFHTSRFDARTGKNGEIILYDEQDRALWNDALVLQGSLYFKQAREGGQLTKYHLEAAIAYWHTEKEDGAEKWENILQLYNQLLITEYSPVAALNRTWALYKVYGHNQAITEAEKLSLTSSHLYYCLLAELYASVNPAKAMEHLQTALALAKSAADKNLIAAKVTALENAR